MKRQPSEWEKIFANEATGKVLISKINKQLTQLNIKIKQIDLNKHFSKEDSGGQKAPERCSTSLIIREMHIKTTMGPGAGW